MAVQTYEIPEGGLEVGIGDAFGEHGTHTFRAGAVRPKNEQEEAALEHAAELGLVTRKRKATKEE